jgi:hypothetical protein
LWNSKIISCCNSRIARCRNRNTRIRNNCNCYRISDRKLILNWSLTNFKNCKRVPKIPNLQINPYVSNFKYNPKLLIFIKKAQKVNNEEMYYSIQTKKLNIWIDRVLDSLKLIFNDLIIQTQNLCRTIFIHFKILQIYNPNNRFTFKKLNYSLNYINHLKQVFQLILILLYIYTHILSQKKKMTRTFSPN